MSDYFSRLIERTMGTAEVVQPLGTPMFANGSFIPVDMFQSAQTESLIRTPGERTADHTDSFDIKPQPVSVGAATKPYARESCLSQNSIDPPPSTEYERIEGTDNSGQIARHHVKASTITSGKIGLQNDQPFPGVPPARDLPKVVDCPVLAEKKNHLKPSYSGREGLEGDKTYHDDFVDMVLPKNVNRSDLVEKRDLSANGPLLERSDVEPAEVAVEDQALFAGGKTAKRSGECIGSGKERHGTSSVVEKQTIELPVLVPVTHNKIVDKEVSFNVERTGTLNASFQRSEDISSQVTPTIKVTIGRVEVKAVTQQTPQPRRAEAPKPRMSLDDYLRPHDGRRR